LHFTRRIGHASLWKALVKEPSVPEAGLAVVLQTIVAVGGVTSAIMTQIDNASRTTALPESHQASHERALSGAVTPAEKMAQLLNGKEKEWAATAEKRGALQLLDLPVDILREIIKEVGTIDEFCTFITLI